MRWQITAATAGLGIICAAAGIAGPPKASAPDYNRDVRPILSRHCFACHGPDDKKRSAGLRLDVRAAAVGVSASGKRAVVPGKPEQSELIRRVATDGPLMMPPAHANKPLSPAQKDVLRRWVASGAPYAPHWAFVAPKQAPLPKVRRADWPRNPVDYFTLAAMERAGLKPSPPADRYALARRVSLDLIGLPPTPEQADAFARDKRPDAYERLVDSLLASPRYGERWARRWLDLARYADTNGYEKDRPRSIWPYRDWVINALNADMPFDRFTVEQLAGDLLPNATRSQRVATGFHRNTMLNEEGGTDPLEFRFHAVNDRVATTGTAWLGLTVGCAQCHTHKFDPITHKEYYRLMAFLNNADEPTLDVPDQKIAKERAEAEREISRREADLANQFPVARPVQWSVADAPKVTTASGAAAENLPDGSVRVGGGDAPDKDTYTVTLETQGGGNVSAVRLDALTDPALGGNGPGRSLHGNFVVTEVTATVAPEDAPDKTQPIRFARAEADFAQSGFPAGDAIDNKPETGWAISGPGNWNTNRALTLTVANPDALPKAARLRWTFTLAQNYGSKHTLGRFRMSVGRAEADNDARPLAERRRERFDAALAAWRTPLAEKAVRWTVLKPSRASANVPVLRVLPDHSVLSTSDITKRDVYDLLYSNVPRGVTALRVEALPHPSLPGGGPGRVYYEGPAGDFFFSELTARIDGRAAKFGKALASFGNAGAAVDGDPLSGWSIDGGQGRAHTAVFVFDKPLARGGPLSLSMLFEKYFASSLGRFRISVTTDPKAGGVALPADVEDALVTAEAERTPAQNAALRGEFLRTTPELAGARDEIEKLRREMPKFPTTLVFRERDANNPRATFVHNRGEFLQPTERVTPGVLGVLPPLPSDAPPNRLTFARWLASPQNPLVGRVAVNRQWEAFFGTGIVKTVEDFGYQGDAPSHPELLDWLAVEFVKQGWSMKKLHRLLVTSSTYRQSSRVTPELLRKDPENRLLARGPRVRLEAELVRDAALAGSGLLSPKRGGPSVFPPQPPGVSSEGAYGALEWKVSGGEDRYRRGLYTFSKRTAPYAMFTTFDAPSGEACVARREVSNTPLQALTLLNDAVFVEAAQALGKAVASRPGSTQDRAAYLFRRCVTRPPSKDELALLVRFYDAQKQRLADKQLDAAALAGEAPGDAAERAAWTVLARSLLNTDEAVTKP